MKKIILLIFFVSLYLPINTILYAQDLKEKILIKAVEEIIIYGKNTTKVVKARIDTGASQSSIDKDLAKELGFNKYIGKINVISANGIQLRNMIEVNYSLAGKNIKAIFTISDRSNLNYKVLIGRNDLKGFLINPEDE
ncbi:MAG: hypothetical protein KatS3mg068_2115 [Candidatus Sericytochromatia bacterium]|nr:MAG: hypothetical protein KatS3mg068_2115 [Candidatus Sericytochromatia bacterium]